jgi:hypothetical protein
VKVEPHSWSLTEDGPVRAEVTQLPLRLAWAITIHKSQGMSLDAAEIDLSRSFTPGMGYVALSRVRSLDGIYLKGLNNMALAMHPDIYEFDARLRQASAALASEVEDLAEDAFQTSGGGTSEETAKPEINQELFEKLRTWRLERARRNQVPPYFITTNSALEKLATYPPATKQQLFDVKGFGTKKCESYGEEILALTSGYAPAKGFEATSAVSGSDSEEPADRPSAPDFSRTREETIAVYPRAFSRWQPEEDQRLLAMAEERKPMSVVCQALQRQPAGVWARLLTLTGERHTRESEAERL